jgi:uncharacterized protein (TIGR02594 family)
MASQGYPMAGSWCGEFAASVVKSTGGMPPKNPAIASNWRNWGVATDAPVPGDVAVRRGARTGSTGSHVTFVENYDPKTGTFTGLGGNQGRWESRFSAGQYDFRHGEMARHGKALRDHFGHRGHEGDLLQQGRRSGLIGGPMRHEVTGSAGVVVDFKNMPRGVLTAGSIEGMFKKITLNRGVAMPLASEGA